MTALIADNDVLSNGASSDITVIGAWGSVPSELLLRVTASGCFFGPDGVTASTGYELLPNVEYRFQFAVTTDMSNATDRTVSVYNNSGGSATVHYVVTPIPR